MKYRVYFLRSGDEKFLHNGIYTNRKEALDFFASYKKEEPRLLKMKLVEIAEDGTENQIKYFEAKKG